MVKIGSAWEAFKVSAKAKKPSDVVSRMCCACHGVGIVHVQEPDHRTIDPCCLIGRSTFSVAQILAPFELGYFADILELALTAWASSAAKATPIEALTRRRVAATAESGRLLNSRLPVTQRGCLRLKPMPATSVTKLISYIRTIRILSFLEQPFLLILRQDPPAE